jgi:serine/threonine protein kinase
MSVEIGQNLSHYEILEKLGEGGMGVVYKARDNKLNRLVALKFLPSNLIKDESTRERLIVEAQAASALDHPNICNIHEINETEDGQLYICMAYYEGESLRQKLKKGPLSVEDSIYVIGGDTQPPILNSVIEYYSGSNGLDEINLQPRNMILHTAIVFEQDIYVFSGSTSSVPSLSPSSTCYYFDTVVGVETQDNDVPENFMLYQNYPNPFNPSTKIKYSLQQSSNVEIKVFDILGNEVETLVDEKMSAGTYQFTWNAKHLPSGLYLYSLQAGDPSTGLPAGRQGSGQGFIETKKMILLK